MLSLLESLQTNGRVDVHRPLLTWTIRKFRSVLATAQVFFLCFYQFMYHSLVYHS